jgi:drug/metabolite transporter (DMT)-like permease
MVSSWLWVVFTLAGSAGQTARNAMQRELTAGLGAVGATHVRFLFGFPFALLFLLAVAVATGESLPRPDGAFWAWLALGAATQILGTALMLLAMTERSFVVTVAYLKTEPVQVAFFGLVFLGDALGAMTIVAIALATAGVFLISYAPRAEGGSLRPVLRGLGAATGFAFSAIGYRGAILALHGTPFIMAASFSLAVGISAQALVLSAWLAWRERNVLVAILRLWRPSLFAGFMGALSSEFWFLALALATAASVRTLALVEVLFAQAVSHYLFKQKTTLREAAGIVLVVTGCALLVWAET